MDVSLGVLPICGKPGGSFLYINCLQGGGMVVKQVIDGLNYNKNHLFS